MDFQDDDGDFDFGGATPIGLGLLREATGEKDLSKAVSLQLHDKRIELIQGLESCPNLRTVDLSFNRISKVEGLTTLSKLKELKLYDNLISNIGMGLQTLSALHALDLSSNRLAEFPSLAGLRGLKVLRLSHNQLPSLEGFGRATQLEVLDVSDNHIKDLAGLSSCISLKELIVSFNQLVNMKGVQRCNSLLELHAGDNRLTSLQGLKIAAATLDVIDVSANCLTSLDSLSDGCTALSELYLAGNTLSGLAVIKAKAPNLETLDLASNRFSDLESLKADLSGLSSLSSVRLEGNPQLPHGYQQLLLDALSCLDNVDLTDRPPPAPEVLTLEPSGAESEEDMTRFEPTIAEIELYKQRMGITSVLPVMGRPVTPGGRPPSAHAMMRSSIGSAGAMLRPGTASGSRPGTAAGRPGSSAGGRPGTAGLIGAAIRDVMMHQRPPSARTGGSGQLLAPDQYSQQVAGFRDTMEDYSIRLRSALSAIKSGLKMDVAAATEQMKAPGAAAARDLPAIPRMPELPKDFAKGHTAGQAAPNGTAKPTGIASGVPATLAGPPIPGDSKNISEPDAMAEALLLYRKLFPAGCSTVASLPSPMPVLGGSRGGGILPLAPGVLGAIALHSRTQGTSRVPLAPTQDGSDSDRDEVICGGGDDSDDAEAPGRAGSGGYKAESKSSSAPGPASSSGPQSSGGQRQDLVGVSAGVKGAGRGGRAVPVPSAQQLKVRLGGGPSTAAAAAGMPESPLRRSGSGSMAAGAVAASAAAGATSTTLKPARAVIMGSKAESAGAVGPQLTRPSSAGRTGFAGPKARMQQQR